MKRFYDGEFCERKRTGRPRKTSREEDSILLRVADEHFGSSVGKLSEIAANEYGLHICAKTFKRRLKEHKYVWRHAAAHSVLSDSHKQKRLQWARAHANDTVKQWEDTIFSDEKKWEVQHRLAFGWARRGRRIHIPRFTFPATFQSWGYFSAHGVGPLHVYRRGSRNTLDGPTFVEILRDILLPHARRSFGRHAWRFVQDNAPCHRAIVVKTFLSTSGVVALDWPANSPDLNPIENLWAVVAQRVDASKPHNHQWTFDEYESVVEDKWKSVDRRTLRNLARSMPKRIQMVIAADGGRIEY